MAILNSGFEDFLVEIEPSDKSKKHAQNAHNPVRQHLENDEDFKEFYSKSFLYGSYKRGTAAGDIKDIDITVITKFDSNNPDHSPKKVLAILKKSLNKYYEDEFNEDDNTEYQRKSILVKSPLPENPEVNMTLDILPAIDPTGLGGVLLIPDKELNGWVQSHPRGHLKYTTKLNNISSQMYVPLVKITKYWWNFQKGKKKIKPKGFWLECLTGENFDNSKTSYAEHFVTLLENIKKKFANFENFTQIPSLTDPGLSGETLKTNMTLEEFKSFMRILEDNWVIGCEALNEVDENKSSILWKKLFGDKFPVSDKSDQKKLDTLTENDIFYPNFERDHGGLELGNFMHKQELLWPENITGIAILRGYVVKGKDKKEFTSNGSTLFSNNSLKFIVKTEKIIGPYQIYWQVVNTGMDASRDTAYLRGGFEKSLDINELEKTEKTLYTGKHWIECFVVQNNVVTARSGRFYVNIYNPKTYPYWKKRR